MLYWYKRSCFTSTKAVYLLYKVQKEKDAAEQENRYTQFACFASTKVQKLTPGALLAREMDDHYRSLEREKKLLEDERRRRKEEAAARKREHWEELKERRRREVEEHRKRKQVLSLLALLVQKCK